jgi:hypothetical protein
MDVAVRRIAGLVKAGDIAQQHVRDPIVLGAGSG